MSKRNWFPAALLLLSATASAQAQYSTGYYGGGDYRTLYSFYPDRPVQWPGAHGYPNGPPSRRFRYYYSSEPVVTLAPAAGTVTIDVLVPENAELWIEGKKMSQTEAQRKFISPPLETGKQFNYELRIRYKEDDREQTKSRSLDVFAGEHYTVDFVNKPKSPGRIEELPAPK
jgi:uncharacterized protein (TIGR03000 family)